MDQSIQAKDKTSSNTPTEVTGQDIGNDKRALHVAGKELVIGVDYDTIDVTYPSGTEEEYSYKLNASEIFKIKVTYTNASKTDLLKVEKV